MKKEKQIGIRVGVPAFFALELEDVYRHSDGAHRALAFPDFVGLLVGLGLEQYRKGNAPAPEEAQEGAPAIEEEEEPENLSLMDIDRAALPDMFRDFDEAMERGLSHDEGPRLRLVRAKGTA